MSLCRKSKQSLTYFNQLRIYFISEKQRIFVFFVELFFWLSTIFYTLNLIVFQKFDFDGFFFLRYFEMFLKIFVFFNSIIISIFIFLNFVHKKNKSNAIHNLNIFNWIDVQLTHMKIYWIHFIMTLIMIDFVCYTIHVKLTKYVHIRQIYLASIQHKSQKLANAILMMNIFDRFLIIFQFTWLYSVFSNDVRAV